MRAVVQRVTSSSVVVDNETVGEISKGLNVLLGVESGDTTEDVKYLAEKIVNLRIFEDENEKMNLSLKDIDGELLVISQFTLLGDCRKGRRPNFSMAEKPDKADELYQLFAKTVGEEIKKVATGVFGADMKVSINNDGPVTLILESKKKF